MTQPVLVDLYCKAGGAARGYADAGFQVLGVDIEPQPNYPFSFERADALEFLRGQINDIKRGGGAMAYHASPPCQHDLKGLSAVNRKLGRSYEHQSLLVETRHLLRQTGRVYVIEQPQQGAQLINPICLCGSAFGLPIRRHRQFESNVLLMSLPCDHTWQTDKKFWSSWTKNGQRQRATVVQVYGNGGEREQWGPALGIDWMTPDELTQAIPPAFTKFIGEQLIDHLETTTPPNPKI